VKLTEKQKRFCDYYIETGNATEAAIRAGYSQKTARFIGAENLTKPNVKSYIDQRLKELEDERIADATEVLQYLTSVMRGEITETRYIAVYDKDGSFVEEREGPPTVRDRNKAAELLAKRYGLLNENMNINAEMAVKIVDDIDDED
jgi:phage terminase small subunit